VQDRHGGRENGPQVFAFSGNKDNLKKETTGLLGKISHFLK